MTQARSITVSLGNPSQLLAAAPPDPWAAEEFAVLGEPAISMLLRRLQASGNRVSELIIRVPESGFTASCEGRLRKGLHNWCEVRIAANTMQIRAMRRVACYALAVCLLLLAAALAIGTAISSENPEARFHFLRSVLGEGVVIAGWVFLWRPIEMLMFDPMPQTQENRLLRRLLTMNLRVEVIQPL